MTLNQTEQDRIWRHHQDAAADVFDLSYPRLRYLANRCAPGTRVLNVGVGSGQFEKLLAARGVQVFALDPSEASISRLRADLRMGERAQCGYAHRMPFESGAFDMVVMTEVLEHLSTDLLHPTLDEVHRVLAPSGTFMGTVPYRENLRSNEVFCPHCQARFHRWGHEQTFDAASLGALLQQHGFRVERMYPRTFPDFQRPHPTLFLKALVRYVLGRMGEPLVSPSLYFRAAPSPAH